LYPCLFFLKSEYFPAMPFAESCSDIFLAFLARHILDCLDCSIYFVFVVSLQNVEHLKCTVSYIVSVCLSGQICVWDIATGDCLRVIHRKRLVCLSCDFLSFLCLFPFLFVPFLLCLFLSKQKQAEGKNNLFSRFLLSFLRLVFFLWCFLCFFSFYSFFIGSEGGAGVRLTSGVNACHKLMWLFLQHCSFRHAAQAKDKTKEAETQAQFGCGQRLHNSEVLREPS